jgi:hypothetical protein
MVRGDTNQGGDNDGHYRDVGLQKEISRNQLESVLKLAQNYQSDCYNLVTKNCTTFAVAAAAICGISISGEGQIPLIKAVPTIGIYGEPGIGFNVDDRQRGKNPADLGQDMLEGHYNKKGVTLLFNYSGQ